MLVIAPIIKRHFSGMQNRAFFHINHAGSNVQGTAERGNRPDNDTVRAKPLTQFFSGFNVHKGAGLKRIFRHYFVEPLALHHRNIARLYQLMNKQVGHHRNIAVKVFIVAVKFKHRNCLCKGLRSKEDENEGKKS